MGRPSAGSPELGIAAGRRGELKDQQAAAARSIGPPPQRPVHDALDEHKRKLAAAVATRFPANAIRARSLANLHRWRAAGAWVSAYDEWADILRGGDDGALFAAMLGRDERSNRLRQSPPYVGLLPRAEVAKLNEEAAA